jgi:hypothetical protein
MYVRLNTKKYNTQYEYILNLYIMLLIYINFK